MKLASKIVGFIVTGIIIVVAFDAYHSVQRERQLFDDDMERDARILGRTLRDLVTDVWRAGDQQRAMELIESASEEGRLRFRWVWLDGPETDRSGPRLSGVRLEQVLRGEEISFKARDGSGSGQRFTYVPMNSDGTRPAALELSESLFPLDEYTRTTMKNAGALAGVVIFVSASLAVMLGVRLVGRPLHRVAEKARRVGEGDLSEPLVVRGRDELTEVSLALNSMCDRLAAARERIRDETGKRISALEQLRHADRLNTVGRLASGMAHELGTPLNVVAGRARLIADGRLGNGEIVRSANIIVAQSERMTDIIKQLLSFARRRATVKTTVDLCRVARQTLDVLAPMAKKRKSTLRLLGAAHTSTTNGDAAQIQQVLTNLTVNALQAMPHGGKVEIEIQTEHASPPEGHGGKDRNYLRLCVSDEGTGISEEDLRHVFEPFFTTKGVGEGTGLGLSIAYGITQEHGGWIDASSELGKGSRFSIYLPLEVDRCADES